MPTCPFNDQPDWMIVNPPFNLVEEFISKSLSIADKGVAIFARLQLLKGVSRYNHIWSTNPPKWVCPFVRRVNCTRDGKGSALAFAWYIWDRTEKPKRIPNPPQIHWLDQNPNPEGELPW